MPDIEGTKRLLDAARRDVQALAHMLDASAFPLEIFGFHAQQAAEKALKGWLCLYDAEVPRSHNIRHLLALLAGVGADTEVHWELVNLSAFAVQFRYEAFAEFDEVFDRNGCLLRVVTLLDHVVGEMNKRESCR